MRPRSLTWMIGTILVVLALTGCGAMSDTTDAGGSATRTPTPTPTATPTESVAPTAPESTSVPTATPLPTPSPTSAATSAPTPSRDPHAPCTADRLDITIQRQPRASGAGQMYSQITFTNTADAACVIEGPPMVFALIDAGSGSEVGKRGRDEGRRETVDLAPGASAYSYLHVSVAGAYDCTTAEGDAARIAPPGSDDVRTIDLDKPVTACVDRSTYNVAQVSASTPY